MPITPLVVPTQGDPENFVEEGDAFFNVGLPLLAQELTTLEATVISNASIAAAAANNAVAVVTGGTASITAGPTLIPITNAGGEFDQTWKVALGGGTLESLADVVITTPVKNQTILFNGTNFVNAASGTSFAFSIASFTASGFATGTQLIGSGYVNAGDTITFSATYSNGPATSGHINELSSFGLTGTGFVGPITYPAAIAYPAVGASVTLTLHAGDGTDFDTDVKTATYVNYLRYGVTAKLYTDSWTEVDIEALTAILSDDNTRTWPSVTAGASERVVLAWPARLATPTFYIGGFELTFDRVTVDVSVTNSAGYVEDYEIYMTSLANLGSVIVVTA